MIPTLFVRAQPNHPEPIFPPGFTCDLWDERFNDAYLDLRRFIKPIQEDRLFFPPPGLRFVNRPFVATSTVEALMFFLNPKESLYGETGVLDRDQYLAIKTEAMDGIARIQKRLFQNNHLKMKAIACEACPPRKSHLSNRFPIALLVNNPDKLWASRQMGHSSRRWDSSRATEDLTFATLRNPATNSTVAAPRLPECLRLLAPLTLPRPPDGQTGNSGLCAGRCTRYGTTEGSRCGTPTGNTPRRGTNCHHGARGGRH